MTSRLAKITTICYLVAGALLAGVFLNFALALGVTGIIVGSVAGAAGTYFVYRAFSIRRATPFSLLLTTMVLALSAWYVLSIWHRSHEPDSYYPRPFADVMLDINIYLLLSVSAVALVLQLTEFRRA